MKKFLISILLFALLFIAFDQFFYFSFLKRSPDLEVDKRLQYILDGKLNKDVVVLGSSRGARNIDAKILEEYLGGSVYNMSYPGSSVEFHQFLLNALLSHNKRPKLLLLCVDDVAELTYNASLTFRYERLYPLASYDYVNKLMRERGEKNELSRFINVLRGNKSNLKFLNKQFSSMDSLDNHGSMLTSLQSPKVKMKKFRTTEIPIYNVKAELPHKINAFKGIVDTCDVKGIKLVICFGPNYYSYNTKFEDRIKELAGKSAYYLCYDKLNEGYKDTSIFYDALHLNRKGAIMFTKDIQQELKQILDK